jgi:hypothetical protein
MSFPDLDNDALSREAQARIIAGDKAKQKAENHYLSAGLFLMEARERVGDGRSWAIWLSKNCPIGCRRADDLIDMAAKSYYN